MTLYKEAIDLINRNVWATNILLLPALMYNILIIYDIRSWGNDGKRSGRFFGEHPVVYERLWILLAILITSVIFFSTIWHSVMFFSQGTYSTLKRIGSLDYMLFAPLFAFVIIILNIVYVVYLYYRDNINDHSKIFFISSIFQIVGIITYILKHFVFYPTYNRRGFLKKIKWAYAHTFFHYISYTGVSLLLSLFYLDNKHIFNTFFEKKSQRIILYE